MQATGEGRRLRTTPAGDTERLALDIGELARRLTTRFQPPRGLELKRWGCDDRLLADEGGRALLVVLERGTEEEQFGAIAGLWELGITVWAAQRHGQLVFFARLATGATRTVVPVNVRA